jgi:hypothetical protein
LTNAATNSLSIPCSGTDFIRGIFSNVLISLAWQPSVSSGTNAVAGYDIFYFTNQLDAINFEAENIFGSPISSTTLLTVGLVTSTNLTLAAAAEYFFYAQCFDTQNTYSGLSDEAMWTNHFQLAIQ